MATNIFNLILHGPWGLYVASDAKTIIAATPEIGPTDPPAHAYEYCDHSMSQPLALTEKGRYALSVPSGSPAFTIPPRLTWAKSSTPPASNAALRLDLPPCGVVHGLDIASADGGANDLRFAPAGVVQGDRFPHVLVIAYATGAGHASLTLEGQPMPTWSANAGNLGGPSLNLHIYAQAKKQSPNKRNDHFKRMAKLCGVNVDFAPNSPPDPAKVPDAFPPGVTKADLHDLAGPMRNVWPYSCGGALIIRG